MPENQKRSLPFMKSMEDAIAVCELEKDNFYLTAFRIEMWVGEVTCRTVAEYAERRKGSDRRLQQGFAAEAFAEIFGHVPDDEFHHLFTALARFGEFDDAQSRTLLRAYQFMALESPVATWPVPVLPFDSRQLAGMVAFMRGTVHRLGQWVEAVIHAQNHLFSHLAPNAFDPDPETRELAVIGLQQRHFPEMNEFQKAWWEWHHGEAAERLSDPAKWKAVGQGMADTATAHHCYPALDECIILFWPLVCCHSWTYRDLMAVLRTVAPVALSYPCEKEQDLASYCNNVLGLRKQSKGKSHPDGTPPGYEVARAMCSR